MLSNGTILKGGPAAELALSDDIKKFYLGINHSEGEVGIIPLIWPKSIGWLEQSSAMPLGQSYKVPLLPWGSCQMPAG